MKDQCKSCTYWNNKQSELDYSNHYGICACYRWKFTIRAEADIRILDRNNVSGKHMNVHTFESVEVENVPIGKVDKSRYLFVTEENFGCIHYFKKK